MLATAGCRYWNGFLKPVGPDYLRPAVAVADQWIEFNDPRVISDARGVDETQWWHVFGDPPFGPVDRGRVCPESSDANRGAERR